MEKSYIYVYMANYGDDTHPDDCASGIAEGGMCSAIAPLSPPTLPLDIVFGQSATNRPVGDRGGSSQAPNLGGDDAPRSSSQPVRTPRSEPATGSGDKEALGERIRAVIT